MQPPTQVQFKLCSIHFQLSLIFASQQSVVGSGANGLGVNGPEVTTQSDWSGVNSLG